MEGPLKGILIDPTGALHNGEGSTCLALCPPCKSALARNKLPRLSLAKLNVIGAVPPDLKPSLPSRALPLAGPEPYISGRLDNLASTQWINAVRGSHIRSSAWESMDAGDGGLETPAHGRRTEGNKHSPLFLCPKLPMSVSKQGFLPTESVFF